MKFTLSVVLVTVLAYSGNARPQDDFTKGRQIEEAPYTLIKSHENGIEEREYPSRNWVCTKKDDGLEGQMFWRLFGYITGDNEKGIKIPMTVPVSFVIDVETDLKEMCFFVSGDQQENPPKPKSGKVFINKRPTLTVFTRKVNHEMSDAEWRQEASEVKALVKSMDGLSVAIDESKFYKNGYNKPTDTTNIRNEAWWVKL